MADDADAYLSTFPPGYRFAPTDQEIILHYLTTKVENQPIPVNKINEVNIYDHTPEYLTSDKFKSYENVWYYYTSRDRKYRNGKRPNRTAGDGYWKATGVDRPINIADDDGEDDGKEKKPIGFKKTLVFYRGKALKGDKTEWIMHEFRIDQSNFEMNSRPDMLLDNYVLCRIYYKGTTKSKTKDTTKSKKSKAQSEPEPEAEAEAATQAQEANTTSTTELMEYSNEKEEEDQRVLNMITDEPAATEVGLISSNTSSSMMDTFGGITFDDPLPIPQQTYHPGPLHVQINNNYMNTSISTFIDDFSTYDSHMEWDTFCDGSEFSQNFGPLDYNDSDMKSSLSVNQKVHLPSMQVPRTLIQDGNYGGSPLSVNKMQDGNYGESPSVNQRVSSMQGGNYDGREYKENDNIFATRWIGSATAPSMIPNYCQDYPRCPALHCPALHRVRYGGCKFVPTDVELLEIYLTKMNGKQPLPANKIEEVDLYSFNPWKLTEIHKSMSYGQEEYYYFTARDRKYPNEHRPNCKAKDGYWRAVGKAIKTESDRRWCQMSNHWI